MKHMALAVALVAAGTAPVQAVILSETLGDVDFTDGQTVGSGTFTSANGGDPSPFNTVIGGDVTADFSTSWSFSAYGGPIAATITSASLQIGLWDGDGAGAGDQVASFSVGGVDLTSLLNTALNTKGGASGSEDWYSVTLPSSVFAALATGTTNVSLTLQNGLGVLGPTSFNGAGVDFSTLTISTDPIVTTPIPTPSVLPLLAFGLLTVPAWRRQRRAP